MWRWPVADLMERPLEELKQGWIKVTLLMGSTEASEEEMTANAIWRGSESQAISSMVTAIQEMSGVRGHLYWTEGGFSWSIEEDMVAKTLALLYWGWRCLALPVSALCVQCKVMFIHCSINSSDSFTNQYNFHVSPSWLSKVLSVAWCGGGLGGHWRGWCRGE